MTDKPKRISKKVAMQCDENMLNYHYQQLDDRGVV